MLSSQITWWDVLWFLQSIVTIAAIFIAYKEGEKRGCEKAKYRRQNRQYKLPIKTISEEDYLNGLSVLQGGKMASQIMRRDIRRMKNKRYKDV